MSEPQETLPEGTRIDAFEIVSLLGRGGMGAVYKAVDRSLDRYVALKTVERGITDDPVSLERFRREAKAASSISHPNVVSIFSYKDLAWRNCENPRLWNLERGGQCGPH